MWISLFVNECKIIALEHKNGLFLRAGIF